MQPLEALLTSHKRIVIKDSAVRKHVDKLMSLKNNFCCVVVVVSDVVKLAKLFIGSFC